MNYCLIFLHIPKAGGSTIHKILEKNYKKDRIYNIKVNPSLQKNIEDFIKMENFKKNNFDLIKGHMSFGLHKYISKQCIYFSIVRNPIDRVVSGYYYVLKNKEHYIWKRHKKNKLSLNDYLNKDLTLEVDNLMTRTFSGMQITDHDNYNEVTDLDFKLAINNIRNNFALVGIMERFDETILLMKNILGIKKIMYYKVNVNKKRKRNEKLNNKIIDKIISLNKYDIRLYEFILNEFQTKIRKCEIIERDIMKYRLKNFLYSNLYKIPLNLKNILIGD